MLGGGLTAMPSVSAVERRYLYNINQCPFFARLEQQCWHTGGSPALGLLLLLAILFLLFNRVGLDNISLRHLERLYVEEDVKAATTVNTSNKVAHFITRRSQGVA
jgi:hypothetical protein